MIESNTDLRRLLTAEAVARLTAPSGPHRPSSFRRGLGRVLLAAGTWLAREEPSRRPAPYASQVSSTRGA